MRTLLLFPPTTVYGDDPSVPPVTQPLGLAYLAAYLEREGHEVMILDFQLVPHRGKIDFNF